MIQSINFARDRYSWAIEVVPRCVLWADGARQYNSCAMRTSLLRFTIVNLLFCCLIAMRCRYNPLL